MEIRSPDKKKKKNLCFEIHSFMCPCWESTACMAGILHRVWNTVSTTANTLVVAIAVGWEKKLFKYQ